MALTLLDAWKTTQRDFSSLALEELVTCDELLPLLPFVAKYGDSFTITREKTLPSFGFISDVATSIGESTGKDEIVTIAKRQAVSDFYVPNMADEESGEFLRQAVKKFKAAGLLISDNIINGGRITGITVEAFAGGAGVDALVSCSSYMDSYRDGLATLKYVHTGTLLSFRAPGDAAYGTAVDISGGDGDFTLYSDNPSKWIKVTLDVSDFSANGERTVLFTSSNDEFDGLSKLVTPGQTRSSSGTNGDALSLDIMDELIDTTNTGNNRAFVMPSKLIRKFKALMRAGGGVDMTQLASGVKVPEYAGIPIIRNDNIAATESKGSGSTLSSVYLVSLGEDEGCYMGCHGGAKHDVNADPRTASLLGFRMYDLGQIQSGAGNVRGGRVAWYGGLAIGSQKSASRAKEIVTA
jgi:hypothetical protein